MARPILDATLIHRQDLSDTLAVMRFALEGGVPDFKPGQFVTLGLRTKGEEEDWTWRAYSIASDPAQKDAIELFIRWARNPKDGEFTTALWKLPVGGKLKHRGTAGAFTVPTERPDGSPDRRRLILVGSGTGVAPFVSMAREMQRLAVPRELIVLQGASYVQELGYLDEFRRVQEETAEAGPEAFKLRHVASISRPDEPDNATWNGSVGRIETLLAREERSGLSRLETFLGTELTPADFCCLVCGYPGTCHAVESELSKLDFRTRRTRREDGSFDMKMESYG